MSLMECSGSCIDIAGTPITILATTMASTITAVGYSPVTLGHAGTIAISVVGSLLLLGILAALAFILVRLQQRRTFLVPLSPIRNFHRYRHHHPHRYSRARWLYADRSGFPLDMRDWTGRIVRRSPRRVVAMGGAGFPLPAPGYNNAAAYERDGVGVPPYVHEAELRRRDDDYGEVYGPRVYGRGEGYVRHPDYPAAAAAANAREQPAYPGMGGMRFSRHGNAAEGAIPHPGVDLQHGGDDLRPGSERRAGDRGRNSENRDG